MSQTKKMFKKLKELNKGKIKIGGGIFYARYVKTDLNLTSINFPEEIDWRVIPQFDEYGFEQFRQPAIILIDKKTGEQIGNLICPVTLEDTIKEDYHFREERNGMKALLDDPEALEDLMQKREAKIRREEERKQEKERLEEEEKKRLEETAAVREKQNNKRFEAYKKYLLENGANEELIELPAIKQTIYSIIENGDQIVVAEGRSPISYHHPNEDGTFDIYGRLEGPVETVCYKMEYSPDDQSYITLTRKDLRKQVFPYRYDDNFEFPIEKIYIDREGNVINTETYRFGVKIGGKTR